MWFFRKRKKKEVKQYPVKSISYEEIREAIREYGKTLPNNVPLGVIIQDNLEIDYQLLSPFLKAVPKERYYMSKETYEIFTEEEKHIAEAIDKIQRAVDQYVDIKKELPVIDDDPYRKVSYHKLEQLQLLEKRPSIDFYITKEEYLITRQKPE